MKWLAVLALALAATVAASPREPAGAEFRAMDGTPVSLHTWKGHRVFVEFWRSDCAPCLQEMRLLPDIARRHQELPIALISLHDAQYTQENLGELPDNVHLLLAQGNPRQLLAAFGNTKTLALPFSVMLDAEGAICGRHYGILGPKIIDKWLEECE